MDVTFTNLNEVVNQIAVEEVEEIAGLETDEAIFYASISPQLDQLQRSAPQRTIEAILNFARKQG